jgi:hypothetical protein
VRDSERLDSIMDMITLSALELKRVYEVDLRPTVIRSESPLLVQVLVGIHGRGSFVVCYDGVSYSAVEPNMESLHDDVEYCRAGGVGFADPGTTKLGGRSMREAIIVFFLTGDQPCGLDWIELPVD